MYVELVRADNHLVLQAPRTMRQHLCSATLGLVGVALMVCKICGQCFSFEV